MTGFNPIQLRRSERIGGGGNLPALGKSVIWSQLIQLIEFLPNFSYDFFSFRIICTCARVATRAIFATPGDATIFNKIASPSQAKDRLCSHGFKVGDLRMLCHIHLYVHVISDNSV